MDDFEADAALAEVFDGLNQMFQIASETVELMLLSARARLREGADVVIGKTGTHGRHELQALHEGLEVIPCRIIDYKGRKFEEMDLDALLKRRLQVALVDELAHTNTPGSRHPKRYLDVEELLASGIDVYTTLNIQHVESLNDDVAKITRIRVRETVPDQGPQ